MFRIDVNIAGGGTSFDKIVEAFGATEFQTCTAAMRAINKTALWVQSKSAREISELKKIQLKLIRQRLRIIKASRTTLRAFITASLYGIEAAKLGIPRQNATGAYVGIHKFPGAFVAKMPKKCVRKSTSDSAGHIGIFKRKTSERLPIRELYVELDPEASRIIKDNIENENKASIIFLKYLKHELEYVTGFAQ